MRVASDTRASLYSFSLYSLRLQIEPLRWVDVEKWRTYIVKRGDHHRTRFFHAIIGQFVYFVVT